MALLAKEAAIIKTLFLIINKVQRDVTGSNGRRSCHWSTCLLDGNHFARSITVDGDVNWTLLRTLRCRYNTAPERVELAYLPPFNTPPLRERGRHWGDGWTVCLVAVLEEEEGVRGLGSSSSCTFSLFWQPCCGPDWQASLSEPLTRV